MFKDLRRDGDIHRGRIYWMTFNHPNSSINPTLSEAVTGPVVRIDRDYVPPRSLRLKFKITAPCANVQKTSSSDFRSSNFEKAVESSTTPKKDFWIFVLVVGPDCRLIHRILRKF